MQHLALNFRILFLVCVFESVLSISISSDEWTGRRGEIPRLTKRQTSTMASTSSSSEEDPTSELKTELFYDQQCIDHTLDCTQKSNQWSQRYWMSMDNYQPGGPIFMFLGGESPVSTWVTGGAWNNYAQYYNATTLVVEHRFYGESFPTPQSNRSPEAMKILTSKQALEDYARILTSFKSNNSQLANAKVVAFGGSYPGFLTAWFRALYPKMVNVAVVSSAPLNYTLEFPEMVETASQVIQQQNSSCFNTIKSAFTCMQSIIDGTGCTASNVTLDNLSTTTNYCGPLNTDIDKANFYIDIGRQIWVGINPGTSTLLPANNLTMSLCDILLEQKDPDIVVAYGNFINASNNSGSGCGQRRKRQSPLHDRGGYTYSWNWQSLNEFANLQVADPVLGMLGTNWGLNREINYYSSYYPNAGFDENKLIESVAKTTEQYPMDFWKYNGTCTIFTYGSWDPWSAKGITNSSQISDKNTVYFIPKAEHMDDFFSPPLNPFANSSITNTQNLVQAQIGTYLGNPDC